MQALIFDLPATFRVGDIADIQLCGQKRRVVWIDTHTLLLVPATIRHIEKTFISGRLRTFVLKDARE